tara:strand:+ start:1271 stop:1972 length:702 start_codon:yes stop_codon:yes gene_type:complete
MDLMAFPMEVLTLIVMLVSDGTELSKLSFIKRNTVKNATDKNLTLISPKTLCILSRICKSFRTEFTSNVYWMPLMVRDFRKGKEYKRPHKNFRKIYMEKLILRDIEPKIRLYNMILIWNQKQLSIKTNNADIYLKAIQNAVVDPSFDNDGYMYKVEGLQELRVNEPRRGIKSVINYAELFLVPRDLTRHLIFSVLCNWRKHSLSCIVYSNQRIKKMQKNIRKQQKIADGIKLI